ncbi:polymorphic toxin type 44 domain-containing protein [Peribacillus kribbensis]|uniref:polymorphic toxin type 44 domain-containing protein n=1 Tax=Peribacillus kribbensis TaxID=356658 RepID=UPI00041E8F9D|nr:polymorphic toxin type 44 domain-containing protein [Peribacillus kribbensis]
MELNRLVYFFQYFPDKNPIYGRHIALLGAAAGVFLWIEFLSKLLENGTFVEEKVHILWLTIMVLIPGIMALTGILLNFKYLISAAFGLSLLFTVYLFTNSFMLRGYSPFYFPPLCYLLYAILNFPKPLSRTEKLEIKSFIFDHVKEIEKETEKKERFQLQNESETASAITAIYKINLISASKIAENYERFIESKGLPYANTYRLGIFYVLTRTNGIWDLKQTLGEDTTYKFKGDQKTGEYIGNHHYGYMGKAIGLSSTVLRVAAGMYQVYSGTSSWKYAQSYFDDPLDSAAVQDGCNDYDEGHRF